MSPAPRSRRRLPILMLTNRTHAISASGTVVFRPDTSTAFAAMPEKVAQLQTRHSRTIEVAPLQVACRDTPLRPSALIPLGTYRATLTVLTGLEKGRLVAVGRNGLVIGCAPEADLVVQGDAVSRHHARIAADEGGGFAIEDLQSASGTFVGAHRVRQSPLVTGDQVQLGREVRLRFRIIDATEESIYGKPYEPSVHDGLTRAFNRPHFARRLFAEVSHARRANTDVAVLMVCVDRLRRVHESYGRLAGDRVLTGIVALIDRSIRTEDVLARYSGDTFAILAPATGRREATRLAERVRLAVEGLRLSAAGTSVRVTVSIGVASLSEVAPSGEPHLELLSLADENLRQAKPVG